MQNRVELAEKWLVAFHRERMLEKQKIEERAMQTQQEFGKQEELKRYLSKITSQKFRILDTLFDRAADTRVVEDAKAHYFAMIPDHSKEYPDRYNEFRAMVRRMTRMAD